MNPELPSILEKILPMGDDPGEALRWALGPESTLTDTEQQILSSATWDDCREVVAAQSIEMMKDETVMEITTRLIEIGSKYPQTSTPGELLESATDEDREEVLDLLERWELLNGAAFVKKIPVSWQDGAGGRQLELICDLTGIKASQFTDEELREIETAATIDEDDAEWCWSDGIDLFPHLGRVTTWQEARERFYAAEGQEYQYLLMPWRLFYLDRIEDLRAYRWNPGEVIYEFRCGNKMKKTKKKGPAKIAECSRLLAQVVTLPATEWRPERIVITAYSEKAIEELQRRSWEADQEAIAMAGLTAEADIRAQVEELWAGGWRPFFFGSSPFATAEEHTAAEAAAEMENQVRNEIRAAELEEAAARQRKFPLSFMSPFNMEYIDGKYIEGNGFTVDCPKHGLCELQATAIRRCVHETRTSQEFVRCSWPADGVQSILT